MRLVRPLDRYVFAEFWRIFMVTALGFPVLVVVIDLTDHLDNYLGKHISRTNIALSYLYWLPDSMFMILPAAVLFATVFSIGAITRHSEITAAKASGISFYRVIRPIFFGAMLATVLGLLLGELVPRTNGKRLELLGDKYTAGTERFNFAYSAEGGRVYKVTELNVPRSTIEGIEIERRGRSPDYPTKLYQAQRGVYDGKHWLLHRGEMHIIPDSVTDYAFAFDSLVDRRMVEKPNELMAVAKAPQDMDYRELGRYIKAMEASGSDVNVQRVERMLKIAIPVTCMVILLFGAPLATSTQRGGAAFGVGISLGTTVVFLMLIQLMKAIGGKGLIQPELAAWVPSIIFGVIGTILLVRVRT